MKRATATCRLAILAAVVCAAIPAAAPKRTITETDILEFVWVADPQISPDGSRVAFVRLLPISACPAWRT